VGGWRVWWVGGGERGGVWGGGGGWLLAEQEAGQGRIKPGLPRETISSKQGGGAQLVELTRGWKRSGLNESPLYHLK